MRSIERFDERIGDQIARHPDEEIFRSLPGAGDFKWLRIIFRLWKTRTTYDEAAYIQQLRKRNSPLAKMLENA